MNDREFTCSECGERFWILKDREPHLNEWERFMPPRFCPSCGTDLKGGKK